MHGLHLLPDPRHLFVQPASLIILVMAGPDLVMEFEQLLRSTQVRV
jgi:hypothetical protein